MNARTMMKREQLSDAIAKTTKMLANAGIKVTQQGSGAFCAWNAKTGRVERINIPMIPDEPTDQFLAALQGFVDHEVSHALNTDGLKGAAAEKASALNTSPAALKGLHNFANIVEDVRIERAMAKEFSGSEANLNATRVFIIDTVWRPELEKLAKSVDPVAKRNFNGMAIVPFIRGVGGQVVCKEFCDEIGATKVFEGLMRAMPDLQQRLLALRDVSDSVKLAEEIMALCSDTPPPQEEAPEENDGKSSKSKEPGKEESKSPKKEKGAKDKAEKPEKEDDEGKGSKGEEKPEKEEEASQGGADDEASDEGDQEGSGDADGEDEGEEGEDSSANSRGSSEEEGDEESDQGEGSGESGSGETDGDGGDDPSRDGGTTEENGEEASSGGVGAGLDIDWSEVKDLDQQLGEALEAMMRGAFDSRHQVCFTREHDDISPYNDRVGGIGEPNVRKVEDEVRALTSVMSKELQRLIVARSASYMAPGFRRGRINSAALHRVPAGDDRVFRRRQESVTNKVAVSLVIDNSGSMRGPKMATAMKAAWAFAETLDRLKVPCDVVGFTSAAFKDQNGRDEVREGARKMAQDTGISLDVIRTFPFRMPIFKGFDEKFGPTPKRRMAHMLENQLGCGHNNDALAIEYAGKRLQSRPETRKIMIVFSDGQPACHVDGAVLNRSLVRNIKMLEQAGVEVIGVGIADKSVSQFYKKFHVISHVAELPAFVVRELRTLLAPR